LNCIDKKILKSLINLKSKNVHLNIMIKEAKILDLKPTQFSLGMKEVEVKINKLKSQKDKEIEEYLKTHPVPVVIGPGGELYLIDHHHLARACWEQGIHKMFIEVKADCSKEDMDGFWQVMMKNNWTYLFDQFGNGPHKTTQLPLDIRCLGDDPYRSLAWAVREAGGFDKCEAPFSEFRWAEYFRKKIDLINNDDGFVKAIKLAHKFCESTDASHLPGYKKSKS
jgi:hypothetical protein